MCPRPANFLSSFQFPSPSTVGQVNGFSSQADVGPDYPTDTTFPNLGAWSRSLSTRTLPPHCYSVHSDSANPSSSVKSYTSYKVTRPYDLINGKACHRNVRQKLSSSCVWPCLLTLFSLFPQQLNKPFSFRMAPTMSTGDVLLTT